MSEFFDYTTGRLSDGATARAPEVNAVFDSISTGLDKLPSEQRMKRGTINYAADTGGVNAFVVTLEYAPSSYIDGMEIVFLAASTNTSDCTINVNGLGAKSIKRTDGGALGAGDIAAGHLSVIRYNASAGYFEYFGIPQSIVTSAQAYAEAAATSASNASGSEAAAADSESSAYTSAGNASASATLAEDWAIEDAAFVSGTDNSAKSWAVGGAGDGAPALGSAKDWATKTGGPVDGTDYSAKHYASQASTAANDAFVGSSVSSVAIGLGEKVFVTQEGKGWGVGTVIKAAYDATNSMLGQVTAYSGTSLTIDVTETVGSGTYASWSMTVGVLGVDAAWQVKTAAYTAAAGDFIIADVGAGGFSVTLPLSPSDNDEIVIKWVRASSANYLTIEGNGNNVNGAAQDVQCNTNAGELRMVYRDIIGWCI